MVVYDHLLESYMQHLRLVKDASPHTIRNYQIDLNAFSAFLLEREGTMDLQKIERKQLRAFLAHLAQNGLSKKSIVRRMSALRAFFKYAHQQNWLTANPADELETPKIEKKIPACLTQQELQVLFNAPDISALFGVRDRAMLELFYSSGLRLSELAALNRADIDSASRLVKIKGKGKKERLVPLTQSALHWISTYLLHPERYLEGKQQCAEQDPQAIFLNRWGQRISTRSIDRNFAAYLKASGLAAKATPHTIRHTIATHLLENGMDLKSIQLILGHSSLAATTIYTKVSNRLKQKVYQEAHPRAKNGQGP